MVDLLDVLFEFKKFFRDNITSDLNKIFQLKENKRGNALSDLKIIYSNHLEYLLNSCEWENPIEAIREEHKKEFCDSYVENTFEEYTEQLNSYMRKLRKEK